MAGAKEIRRKIKSIKKTQKITRAMEMVAASKMRKAQERMFLTRPYANKIRQVISHLGLASSEYHHPFLEVREPKRVGYIVVSTDRGLCGGLNNNLFRQTLSTMRNLTAKQIDIDMCLIGTKAENFFSRIGAKVIGQAQHLGDEVRSHDLIGIVKIMLDNYSANALDAVYVVYNHFVNTMSQKITIDQLLPITNIAETEDSTHWDYIYEPDARQLIDALLVRYIESQVYQAVVENLACEQAARMVAMKNATENAGQMINSLQLDYNKARQAAITQELAEIVAGAAAV